MPQKISLREARRKRIARWRVNNAKQRARPGNRRDNRGSEKLGRPMRQKRACLHATVASGELASSYPEESASGLAQQFPQHIGKESRWPCRASHEPFPVRLAKGIRTRGGIDFRGIHAERFPNNVRKRSRIRIDRCARNGVTRPNTAPDRRAPLFITSAGPVLSYHARSSPLSKPSPDAYYFRVGTRSHDASRKRSVDRGMPPPSQAIFSFPTTTRGLTNRFAPCELSEPLSLSLACYRVRG